MPLSLTRKSGQAIYVGNTKITVMKSVGNGNRVSLIVDAAAEVPVFREEVYLKIREQEREDADSGVRGEA